MPAGSAVGAGGAGGVGGAAGGAAGGATSERIAVAIPVPPVLADELQRRRAESGDPLAWSVPPHITLVPPVGIGDDDLPRVREHLARAAAVSGVFEIRLRGTSTFRPVSPVVFVELVEGAPEVGRIEARVRSGVLESRRHFPFHPHVTLAQNVDDAALDRVGAMMADYEGAFTASCFVLYRHGDDGMWRPAAEYPLG